MREDGLRAADQSNLKLPPACTFLGDADASTLVGKRVTRQVNLPRRCEWVTLEGRAVVVVVEDYGTLSDALRQFQESGDPLSAPDGFGVPALLKADGPETLMLAVFVHGWQLTLSAPTTEDQLLAAGSKLVAIASDSTPTS